MTPVSVGVISTAAPFSITEVVEGASAIVGGGGGDDADAVSRLPPPHAVKSTTEHIASWRALIIAILSLYGDRMDLTHSVRREIHENSHWSIGSVQHASRRLRASGKRSRYGVSISGTKSCRSERNRLAANISFQIRGVS
jgi:hypothetical protein